MGMVEELLKRLKQDFVYKYPTTQQMLDISLMAAWYELVEIGISKSQ